MVIFWSWYKHHIERLLPFETLNSKLLQMQLFILRHIVYAFLLLSLSSCHWNKNPKASFLIIAVEELGFDQIQCNEEELYRSEYPGFSELCGEAVRFTHAFAPSSMSAPTLGSILTGLYPSEHGLRDNQKSFLPAKNKTIAEVAISQNYRTAFFSGGPPIWRKSNLNQGFELFEDNIAINFKKYFRPVEENLSFYKNWLQNEVGNQASLAVIFIPDLQFKNYVTITNDGVIRRQGAESQIKEVAESLHKLFHFLKKTSKWDNTNIILVGLNAPGHLNNKTTSLKSNRTRVSLLIKPARKARDLGLNWTIDKNISLVDLGSTLFDWFNKKPIKQNNNLKNISFLPALYDPASRWNNKRSLLIEAPNTASHMQSFKYAIRKGHYLAIIGPELQVYDTLVDREENIPLQQTDTIYRQIINSIETDIAKLELTKPSDTFAETEAFIDTAARVWNSRSALEEKRLALTRTKFVYKEAFTSWSAYLAIKNNEWAWLQELAGLSRRSDWQYLAMSKLNQKPHLQNLSSCLKLILEIDSNSSYRHCDKPLLKELLKQKSKRVTQLLANTNFKYFIIDKNLAKLHYANSMNWDIDTELLDSLSLIETYLAL